LRRQLRFWKRRPSSGRGVAVKGADFQCFQGCWCIYTKRYRSVEQLMRILPGIYAYNMCIYRLYTYIDMCVWTLWDGDGEREREKDHHIYDRIFGHVCIFLSLLYLSWWSPDHCCVFLGFKLPTIRGFRLFGIHTVPKLWLWWHRLELIAGFKYVEWVFVVKRMCYMTIHV
jgi:hypothetical protein